jgi:multiple sugar transport system permease protein
MIDSYHGIILLHTVMNLPLATLLLKSFLDEVPRELDEAALVDGANRWQAFRVVLHYIRPGLSAAAILAFIFSWNEFLLTLVLTKGIVRTMPVAASTFITAYGVEWGYLAALGSAAMVPVFIFILLVQKHLVRGLTLGAVKG